MATSLYDGLMSLVTPQLLGALSSKLGESSDSVQRGLETSGAAMLGTLAKRSSEPGFIDKIAGLVQSPVNDGGVLSNLGSLASGGASSGLLGLGSQFLGQLFGGQQSAVADAIGRSSGMKSSSVSSLLAMAAPMLLSYLGRLFSSGQINTRSLTSMLSAEAPKLAGLMPAGLSNLAATPARVVAEAESGTKWLFPGIVAALVAAALLWFFTRDTTPARVATEKAATAVGDAAASAGAAVADATKIAWAALGELVLRKLPGGIELNIPKLGVEYRLLDFIEGPGVVDGKTWYDFDRLLFDTGKATLQPASNEQLENIAKILKAYPSVRIKIGGYTDNTGESASNLKLSADRAKNVMDELVRLGVSPSRLESEGYGDSHPVGDNATEEGRAKNRRISMRLTHK